MATQRLDSKQLIFSGTASQKGRHISVTPENSTLAHLAYGRIRLDAEVPRVAFETGERETAFICMKGACRLTVNGEPYELGTYDGAYVPRGTSVEVMTTGEVDLVECSADVTGDYPLQIVRYADVKADAALKFTAGGDATTRDLNIIIGKNVTAGRLLAGFTRSKPGNWTSWPPHEHTKLLEEVYVYFDMPEPGFGIQLVYTEPNKPEFVSLVRDGDAVLMPAGYHPNVAAPGHSINFVWMMAAHREVDDRQFGVVNVQPGFDQAGSGLEASQKPGAAR
ncbi:MAG TPA: 5-deoxy-glucuronate isomerase [Polyangiaceae bacterium]|jgi:5-deoxy-glucuronate isomerase|nr:5-deoxy-glucuronate isomerase [Polyangiaceae bacterium]